MKRVLAILSIVLVVSPVARCYSFGDWQYGLRAQLVPVKSPEYAAPWTLHEDAWGDHYVLGPEQKATSSGVALSAELRTPKLNESETTDIRLGAEYSWIFSTPSRCGDLRSHFSIIRIGPVVQRPVGDGMLEFGAHLAIGNSAFAADKMYSAWPGDPGYGTYGGYFIAPGTPIMAKASANGLGISVGYSKPWNGDWAISARAVYTSGLEFSDFEYHADGKYGGGIIFDLPQLKPVDLSGLALAAGITASF